MMKNVIDFTLAALPWLCMGLLLAIFFAKSARKKKDETNSDKEKESYISEGMSIGMCLGVALGASFGNVGLGISLGMLLGLAVGSCVEKKENGKDE